jgi:ABC-2 type transport system ATP-binding protein
MTMNGLILEGISRRFGDRVVLEELNLTVGQGEIVGFIGGNGAGKTTTMRIILGMLAADRGTVSWGGGPVDDTVRRAFGYMPEERGLYPRMPVREQIEWFARLDGSGAATARKIGQRLVAAVGLQGREQTAVQDLSLGNQQRVQLAVALVGDPQLLVLDEPFSGLDPEAVEAMADLLQAQANRGVAVLFSSHQLELVERLCDRVCVLQAGRVVVDGTVEELDDDGTSRWSIEFQGTAAPFLQQAGNIPGVLVSADAQDPARARVAVDGSRRPIPAAVLAAAGRSGTLMGITPERTSLAEVLSGRRRAAEPRTPPQTRALVHH